MDILLIDPFFSFINNMWCIDFSLENETKTLTYMVGGVGSLILNRLQYILS